MTFTTMPFTAIPATFDEAVADLRTRISGAVLVPGDEGYAAAVTPWNLAYQQHPAVAVVPESSAEVAEAVRFAKAGGLRVAVQATGHGMARPADGAVLIVTSKLTAVRIDPVARTAYVAAGALWSAVLHPAQVHGLAPLLGSTPELGAVGYTLGGGMGWLARQHGLASDSVRAFELVTPDGIEVRASAEQQPELFWALKGGGAGTIGVVTGMEIDLYPVTTVYAGNLLYPVELAREVMLRWRDWVATVGTELTSSVVIMNFPPFEAVPEPLRGQSFVIVRGAWCGDQAEGEALVDQWRTWRTPAVDLFGPLPFSAIALVSNDPVDPSPAMVSTEWFDTLADEAVDVLIRATVPRPGQPPALLYSEIRHAGGAIRARAHAAANDRGRSGEFLLQLTGMVADPHAGLALEAHLRQTRRALAPYVTGAAYLNFLEGREKQERTAAAFSPDHLARVKAVKAALDGDDRFAHGLGIAPA